MRRFELVEGTSSKFWEVGLEGAALTVRFGRIGTNGQTQQKSFPNAQKASAERDKLVAEKLKKGYSEVGAGDVVSAPVASAATKPAKVAKVVAAPDHALAQSEAPTRGGALTSPPEPMPAPLPARGPLVATDPFTWPAELRAELHPSRAWPAPPIQLDRAAIWKKLRERADKPKLPDATGLQSGKARLETRRVQ